MCALASPFVLTPTAQLPPSALLGSGAAMRAPLVAVPLALDADGRLVANASAADEASSAGCATFAFLLDDADKPGGCVLAHATRGRWPPEQLLAALAGARAAAAAPAHALRDAARKQVAG